MGSKPHPDKELAERAAAGDDSAWREIYTATRERLFALLSYHIGARDEALDVLQETYLAAVRGIAGYEGRGSLESWLCGIALRRARDWKRRVLTRLKNISSLTEENMADEAAPQPDPEERRRLRRALEKLSARQRTAVLLHEWMGYSFREVGDVMNVSEATARVHCFRGREALKTLLTAPPEPFRKASLQEERS